MELTPFSIVQMPKGVPVATFAIGDTGAFNAALEAVAILAAGDESLTEALYEFRKYKKKVFLICITGLVKIENRPHGRRALGLMMIEAAHKIGLSVTVFADSRSCQHSKFAMILSNQVLPIWMLCQNLESSAMFLLWKRKIYRYLP